MNPSYSADLWPTIAQVCSAVIVALRLEIRLSGRNVNLSVFSRQFELAVCCALFLSNMYALLSALVWLGFGGYVLAASPPVAMFVAMVSAVWCVYWIVGRRISAGPIVGFSQLTRSMRLYVELDVEHQRARRRLREVRRKVAAAKRKIRLATGGEVNGTYQGRSRNTGNPSLNALIQEQSRLERMETEAALDFAELHWGLEALKDDHERRVLNEFIEDPYADDV